MINKDNIRSFIQEELKKAPNLNVEDLYIRYTQEHPEDKEVVGLKSVILNEVKNRNNKGNRRFNQTNRKVSEKRTERINKLMQRIKKKGKYKINPSFTPNATFIDGTSLKKKYYALIGKKTLKNDKQLMDDIIKHKKEILQHRISCDITLYSQGRLVAGLKVFHTLVEHGQSFVDFWYGLNIDPSSWSTMLTMFQGNLGHLGIKSVHSTITPTEKVKIEGVGTSFTFA